MKTTRHGGSIGAALGNREPDTTSLPGILRATGVLLQFGDLETQFGMRAEPLAVFGRQRSRSRIVTNFTHEADRAPRCTGVAPTRGRVVAPAAVTAPTHRRVGTDCRLVAVTAVRRADPALPGAAIPTSVRRSVRLRVASTQPPLLGPTSPCRMRTRMSPSIPRALPSAS